jgi:Flp pilus assembly protein TadD/ketosteroid isomerase-like protein
MTIRSVSPSLNLAKILIQICLVLSFSAGAAFADELKDISQMADSGQQAAALERVNTYLAANPKDAQALFMKGIILVEVGKRDEAIVAFTDLTNKYPNLPEPYNNLAVLYADAGQYDKAKKALETAIKTHPSYATAHENLGDIYARMASEAYDKALQLDKGNTRAESKLALIKDLFGTGNKTTLAAASNKPAEAAKAEPAKTNKTDTKPIRAADKKVDDKPVAAATGGDEQNITDAVNQWAKAWSAKDVDKYLASYSETFKPAKGETRKAWAQSRKERVSRPASISVEVTEPKVTLEDANNAKVSFRQNYKADGKPIRTSKTLVLKKANSAWLIEQEIASN